MISKNTIKFLDDLKKNNNKPWFEANRSRFEAAKINLDDMVGILIKGISEFDPDIALLEVKNCTFRQYRDVRFSHDKTPYKVNMGAFFNKGGKKVNNAGYYLHVEPGKSLYAGGFWMPEAQELAKIRQEIDYNFDEWQKLLKAPAFRKNFPGGIDMSPALKRAPKGYDEENPAISYLKLKSFTALTSVSDETLTGKGFAKKLLESYKSLMPVIKFLNRAIE